MILITDIVQACVRNVVVWRVRFKRPGVDTVSHKKSIVRGAQLQLNSLSALVPCRDVSQKVECTLRTEKP